MKSVTYLIYIIAWEGFTLGGCSYLVFWEGASGWWFLLALLISGSAYSPSKWSALYGNASNKREAKNE